MNKLSNLDNLSFPKLVKDNRFWEIILTNQNNISIYTKYGVIGGKITETKPQIFTDKSSLNLGA